MTPHPTIIDLLERSDEPSVRAHVAECPICDARRMMLEVEPADPTSLPGISEARRALFDARRLASRSLEQTWGADPFAELQRPAELEIGRLIDRYRVCALIDSGGMGTLYRVEHEQLGSSHALKVLHRTSESVRDRLILEGRAQSRMQHANVVPVTDVVDVDGAPGLIMAFVDGPALSDWLRASGAPPIDVVWRLGEQMLRAVGAAHAAGIVHRDLKPSNVLIASTDEGPAARVCDFGLALWRTEESGDGTASAGPLGTPGYMAPEQIRDASSVDARSDLFSLGAVLYELATGHRAFEGRNHLDVWERIHEGRYTPPRELRPDLPEAMDTTIRRALAVDPADRFATATDMLAAWRQAAPSEPAPLEPRRPSLLTSPATLGLAVAAVIATASVGLLATRTGPPQSPQEVEAPLPGDDRRDRRLTAMPADYQIFSIALSDDDDGLLYTDGRGVWLQSAHQGTTRAIVEGGPFHSVDWLDAKTAVVAGVHEDTKGLWTVDVTSGRMNLLAEMEGYFVRVSPDGQQIAYAVEDAIAVMRIDGTELRNVREFDEGEHCSALTWSPDGRFLAIVGMSRKAGKPWVERFTPDGSEPVRLVDDHRLVAMGLSALEWIAPDRMVYAYAPGFKEPPMLRALDDASTAENADAAVTLRTWDDYALIRLRAGGSALVASRGSAVQDIWLMDPDAPETPQLLTPEDWDDRPIGWADRELITSSNRGAGGLFTLSTDSAALEARPLPELPGFKINGESVADGLLIAGFGKNTEGETTFSVDRIEEATGEVRPLLSRPAAGPTVATRPLQAIDCAADRCLVSQPDQGTLSFQWLDPVDGTLSETVVSTDYDGRSTVWALSPEADRVVLLLSDPPTRLEIDLTTSARTEAGSELDLPVAIDWAADGTIYASGLSHSSVRPYRIGRLQTDGALDVIRSSMNENFHSIYAAPDSGSVALGVYSFGTDVWRLELEARGN